jgi:hypothetical protein
VSRDVDARGLASTFQLVQVTLRAMGRLGQVAKADIRRNRSQGNPMQGSEQSGISESLE